MNPIVPSTEKGPRPAELRHQPAGQRREDADGEILRGRKQGGCATPFGLGKPHHGDAGIRRKARRLDETEHESQREDDRDGPRGAADELAHEAEHECGKRPENKRDEIDLLGSEIVEDQSARDLSDDVGPAEGRKDVSELNRRKAERILDARAGDGKNRAVRIGYRRENQDDPENPDPNPGLSFGDDVRCGCDCVSHDVLLPQLIVSLADQTGVMGGRPASTAAMLSRARKPMASRVSTVALATCGVRRTFGSAASRKSKSGSRR